MNQTITYTTPEYDKINLVNKGFRPNIYSRVEQFNDVLFYHIPRPINSILPLGKRNFYSEHCSLYVNGKINLSHSVIFNAFALIVRPDNQQKLTGYFYKSDANGVSKGNGDFFCFCEPSTVIPELNKLVSYVLNNKELLSIEQAAIIFYGILKIHPFEDNNGKTARLLCDMTLLRNGSQPAFNVGYDRLLYKKVIDLADNGDYSGLVDFIYQQQLYSIGNL